jgi:uridine kinase
VCSVANALWQSCTEVEANRKKAEIPVYSFAKHQRQKETTSIYSPHVLILEGIFALYDPRVLELLDMRVRLPVALLLLGPRNFSAHGPDILRS